MPHMYDDAFTIQSMGYKPYTPRADSCWMAAVVGAAVVVVYTTLTKPSSPMYHPMAYQLATQATAKLATTSTHLTTAVHAVSAKIATTGHVVTSQLASTGNAVSAKLAVVVGGNLHDAQSVYSELPKGAVFLIDCTKRTQDGWKQMSDSEKATCYATAKSVVAKYDKLAIMLFAPWCPHCHSAMSAFAEMSAQNPGVPFVMINAEALPRDAFTGPTPFFPLEYFPTFAYKTSKEESLQGAESIASLGSKFSNAAVSGKRAVVAGPTQPDPFADLF